LIFLDYYSRSLNRARMRIAHMLRATQLIRFLQIALLMLLEEEEAGKLPVFYMESRHLKIIRFSCFTIYNCTDIVKLGRFGKEF